MRLLLPEPAAALLATLAVAACAACAAGTSAAPGADVSNLPRIDAGTSLLVIAPHPDDETLCCGGIIQRVVQAGGRASVVWITSGDAEWLGRSLAESLTLRSAARAREFGARRMAEARAATALLGVPASGQLFLGYPDGGVPDLLSDHRLTPYRSSATGATAVPYPDAVFPGHPYTGESLERDFAAVLERTRPTLILAPSPLDDHPDHRATGLLTIAVSTRRGSLPRVRYWIVHGGEGWPSPRDLLPGVPLTPAPLSRGLVPAAFTLEPTEEDRKLLAVRAYATQMREMAPFLLSFVRTTELFFPRPQPLPAPPPPS
jgi:LmbE family N-acetylglucosaminyl deacetylase